MVTPVVFERLPPFMTTVPVPSAPLPPTTMCRVHRRAARVGVDASERQGLVSHFGDSKAAAAFADDTADRAVAPLLPIWGIRAKRHSARNNRAVVHAQSAQIFGISVPEKLGVES